MSSAAPAQSPWVRWLPFALVSAVSFHTTASTFTSLGVVFPFMVQDLSLDFTEAGLGFTILALMVGLSGQLPAWTLRHIGVQGTFGVGGAIMAAGFGLLATANGLMPFLIGAGLAGIGYTLAGAVPSLYVINQTVPDRQSFAIGAYFTIGGLGGVVGPSMVPAIVELTGSWRYHWWVMLVSILILAGLCVAFIQSRPDAVVGATEETPKEEKLSPWVFRTKISWEFRAAIRTPQYIIIVSALTMTLFAGVTMNAWAVTHMNSMGVPIAFAAAALSGHQAVNAIARALGGFLATKIDPKWLLATGLAFGGIGMTSLAFADNTVNIVIFAVAEGFGFGLVLFATAMLLVNYFGPKKNPELLGTMHVITSVGAAGPILGGFIGDTFGGFGTLFIVYAGLLAVVMAAAILMKPPVHPDALEATKSPQPS